MLLTSPGPYSVGNANSFFIRRCIYVDLHPQEGIRFLETTENMCIFINDTTFRSCFTDYQSQSGGSFYWRDQGIVAFNVTIVMTHLGVRKQAKHTGPLFHRTA